MNEVDMSIDTAAYTMERMAWPVKVRLMLAKKCVEEELFHIRYGYKEGKVPGEQVHLNVSPLGAVARVSWAWIRGLATRPSPMP